jgi:hypothetical protein
MAKISLCDTCGVANANGEPCGIMFEDDVVEHCSAYVKDEKAHKKLLEKYGPEADKPKVEEKKADDKGGQK